MRKNLKFAIALAGGLLALTSCSGANSVPLNYQDVDLLVEGEWVDYAPPATDIVFEDEEKSITLKVGETYTYNPTISPRKTTLASVDWASDDESVATINKGVLTAVGGGSTSIIVSSRDDSFMDVELNVNVVVPLQDITLSSTALDLDFSRESRIGVTFNPIDTTETDLIFTSSNPDVATVDNNGLILSKNLGNNQEGYTTITVSSAVHPNISKELLVHVIDMTVHVDSITLKENEEVVSALNMEVGTSKTLTAAILPEDATHKEVNWTTDNPASLSVANGEIIAAIPEEPLDAPVYANITVSGENNSTVTVPVTITEVVPASMAVSTNEVDIDTVNMKTAQLEVVYKNGGGEVITPSITKTVFTSEDESIARVDENGLITAVSQGEVTINVSDSRHLGVTSIPVTVHVRKGTTGIKLKIDNKEVTSYTVYPGDEFDLVASVVPDDSYFQDVEFEIATGAVAIKSYSQVGNTLHVLTDKDLVMGKFYAIITAKCGGVSSTLSLTVSDEGLPFTSGRAYIVGMDKTEKLGFGNYAHPSWQDSRFAEEMVNDSTPYEKVSTVYFKEGDQWKIRYGDEWMDIVGSKTDDSGTHQTGYYKITEGAFASGKMQALKNADGSYGNIEVLEEGFYDIYFMRFDPNDESKFKVYVGDHNLTVNKSKTTIILNEESTIVASHWNGSLDAVSADSSKVAVKSIDTSNGNIVLEGKDLTDGTVVTVSDDYINVDVNVVVRNSVATDGYYLVGQQLTNWQVDIDYTLTKDMEDANHYYINDLPLDGGYTLKVYDANNDAWLSNESTYPNCGYSIDESGNVVVTNSGTYTVSFYINSDTNNHITLSRNGTVSNTVYLIGTMTGWDTTDNTYKLTQEGNDTNHYYISHVVFDEETALKVYNSLGANDGERYVSNNHTYEGCNFTLDKDMNIVVPAGTYDFDFYMNSDDGNHITVHTDTPIVPHYYVMHGNDSDGWTQVSLIQNGEQYYVTDVHLDAGEEIVFEMGGEGDLGWRHYSQLKESEFALAHFEAVDPDHPSSSNIKVKAGMSGDYDFYIGVNPDASGDYAGKSIWISASTKYYVQFGSIETQLIKRDLTDDEKKIEGLQAVYETHMDVTKDDHFSFIKNDEAITSNIGPDGDDLTNHLYNNWVGDSGNPTTWEIKVSGTNVLVKIAKYTAGYSFWIEGGDSEDHTPEVPIVDTVGVYFTNNHHWAEVKVYAFGTSGSEADWPGKAMTKVAVNRDGDEVYYYEVDRALYNKIVFTNGIATGDDARQTSDISLNAWELYDGYYCGGEYETHKYTAGHYVYGLEVSSNSLALEKGHNGEVSFFTALGDVSIKNNSHPERATAVIDDGKVKVTSLAVGETVITITDGVRDVAITVNVKEYITYEFWWNQEGVYGGGSCNVVAWVWGGEEAGRWVDVTYVDDKHCTLYVETTITGVQLVQVDSGVTASNMDWSKKKTQTGTITVDGSNPYYQANWPW